MGVAAAAVANPVPALMAALITATGSAGIAAASADDIVGGGPCWEDVFLEPTEEKTPQESAEGIISTIKAKFNYALEPYRGDAVLMEEEYSANVLYMLEPGQLCKKYEGAIAIDAETGVQYPKLWEGDTRTITGTSDKFDPATNLTKEIYLDDGTILVPGNEAAIWDVDEGQLLVVGYKIDKDALYKKKGFLAEAQEFGLGNGTHILAKDPSKVYAEYCKGEQAIVIHGNASDIVVFDTDYGVVFSGSLSPREGYEATLIGVYPYNDNGTPRKQIYMAPASTFDPLMEILKIKGYSDEDIADAKTEQMRYLIKSGKIHVAETETRKVIGGEEVVYSTKVSEDGRIIFSWENPIPDPDMLTIETCINKQCSVSLNPGLGIIKRIMDGGSLELRTEDSGNIGIFQRDISLLADGNQTMPDSLGRNDPNLYEIAEAWGVDNMAGKML